MFDECTVLRVGATKKVSFAHYMAGKSVKLYIPQGSYRLLARRKGFLPFFPLQFSTIV